MHLFRPGYVDKWTESCRRVLPDEVTLYEALAREHGIKRALVVGYEGQPAYRGNNRYIARLAATHAWMRPVAFATGPKQLTVPRLEQWRAQGFVGVSMYLFSDLLIADLKATPDQTWEWMTRRRFLISVNSRGRFLNGWRLVMGRHPALRVIVSHLGLPTAVSSSPTDSVTRRNLKSVLALAKYPSVHVKLSAFYALTVPGFDYPHCAAWPYVKHLVEAFGVRRLLWGSDFCPCLEHVGFAQTYGLFCEMPFLSSQERSLIEGGNLFRLLDQSRS